MSFESSSERLIPRETLSERAPREGRRVAALRCAIDDHVRALLAHRYFDACAKLAFSRAEVIEILKQLYCFSIFFERVLTRRVSNYPSHGDRELVRLARVHLREESGHAELFRQCLVDNGVALAEIDAIAPKTFTKATFGYLLATIEYEHEIVANVAIMQVMERIGFHFFDATLKVMSAHGFGSAAFVEHARDDQEHANLGFDLCETLDDDAMNDALRVVRDVFRLMALVFDEWMGARG